jgi:hypothetical protein
MNRKKYSRVIPFGDNFIVRRKKLWGIVNKNDNELLPIEYTRVYWFEGGYAGIQRDNLWGLVDTNGQITIFPQYNSLLFYEHNKVCEVELSGKAFIVDVNNKIILKREDDNNVYFKAGKLMLCSKGWRQLFNIDGTPYSKRHGSFIDIGERFFAYDDIDGKQRKTIIKANGEEFLMPDFEIGVFDDYIAPFRFQNKYGIIDENAQIVIPNKYDFITLGSGVIALNEGCKTKDQDSLFSAFPFEGSWYFWNYQFQEITHQRYERISHEFVSNTQVWFAKRDEQWYRINPQGEVWFAKNDAEFNKKVSVLVRKKHEEKYQLFGIASDESYKGEGRKLYVRSCDGHIIRHFYYTPYLPMTLDDMEGQLKVGESFVNVYGQDMPNLHSFKMPKQRKPRYIFRKPEKLLRISKNNLMTLLVELLKKLCVDLDSHNAIALYTINNTKQKRVIFVDWLIRKYKQSKKARFNIVDLINVSEAIGTWLKRNNK